MISIQEAFSTLGLTREASPQEVKKAYRKLALQFHPDKNRDPAATAKFQQLSAAYKRIDDHLKRGLNVDNQRFEDFFGGDEFDEEDVDFGGFGVPSMEEMLFMFDMLFGSPPQAARGGRGTRRNGKKRGEIRVDLRRKSFAKRQMPPGFPSYIDQEFMDMFAHGMAFGDLDSELSDLEDEVMSMEGFFCGNDLEIPPWINENRKNKTQQANSRSVKHSKPEVTSAPNSNPPEIGSRVHINGKHSGIVMFTGCVHYAKGKFVGIALSSPVGKNDGSIKGVRYFECLPSHGLMVRPNEVTLAA